MLESGRDRLPAPPDRSQEDAVVTSRMDLVQPSRRILVVALTAVAALPALVAPPPVLAWGRMGHRAAARLAEARLSPAARAAVKDLLEPGETLADASTWADEYRSGHPETGPWHYVNVPITEPRYRDSFCIDTGCVVRKVADFRRALADKDSPREERQKALRFLVHFLQDMHQPVHVGDRSDRGGNDLQVRFFGEGSNLHRVWDSGLIERGFDHESTLLLDLTALTTGEDAAAWPDGTVEDWADESLAAARAAYRDPATGRDLRKGAKLGEGYHAANLPVARRRLAQAGVRLAETLNGLFPDPVDR